MCYTNQEQYTMTQVLVSSPLASFPDRLQNDYFEILTTLTSERLPACRDLRACTSPWVRHMAVTANSSRMQCGITNQSGENLVYHLQFHKHTIAECFTCHLTENSHQFTLHHQ